MNSRILVFDTETTGLSAKTDRIIEFAGVSFDLGDDGEVSDKRTYVRRYGTKRAIHPKAQAVHGIGADDIRGLPEAEDDNGLVDFCLECDVFVAHNLDFDRGFIAPLMSLDGIGEFCTMENGRWATWDGRYPNLGDLAFACSVAYDPAKAHAALYDVAVTCSCLLVGVREGLFDPAGALTS